MALPTNVVQGNAAHVTHHNTIHALMVTGESVQVKLKAGTPTDADFTSTPANGTVVVNSSTDRVWYRKSGVWTEITSNQDALIAKATVDAKGDMIAASANDTVARLPVGTNDQVLTADSAQTLGVKWAGIEGWTTISRALPTVVNNYVEIGKWAIVNGAHNVLFSVTVEDSGISIAKTYLCTVNYDHTAGIWRDLIPLSDSGPYDSKDWALEVRGAGDTVFLRLRRTLGTNPGTAWIQMRNLGKTADVFTAQTGTGASANNADLFLQGSDTPQFSSIYVKEYPGVDPRHPDFGADPTGVADSTAAINNAIEACFGANANILTPLRYAKFPLYLGAGDYKTTSPLLIRNAQGFTFKGAGNMTHIVPSAAMDQALLVDGAAEFQLEDFRIDGNGFDTAYQVRDCIGLEWINTAYRSTSGMRLRNVRITNVNCQVGISVGLRTTLGRQVSEGSFYHIAVTGGWPGGEAEGGYAGGKNYAGIVVGEGTAANNLNHYFYGCDSVGWKLGVSILSVENVNFFGGDFGSNFCDFESTGSGTLLIDGFRSEESKKFLRHTLREAPWHSPQDGASLIGSYGVFVTTRNVRWMSGRLHSDDYYINWGHRGHLRLENHSLQDTGPGTPRVILQPTGPGAHISAEGCSSELAPDSWIVRGNSNVTVSNRGYIQHSGGSATKSWGDSFRGVADRESVYTSAGHPSASIEGTGSRIYDTTLSKPVWSDGVWWKDAAGNVVY